MLRVFWTSKSSMNTMQDKLDTISNNLANVNTIGYKSVDISFQDLVYEKIGKLGVPVNNANTDTLLNGTGVKVSGVSRDDIQGEMITTGVQTDFFIDGNGYFKVKLPNNTDAYVRNGQFSIDVEGNLTDTQGNKVEVNLTDNNFKFTQDNFHVEENGDILSKKTGAIVGKIKVYSPIGDNSFISIGDNLYVPKDNNVTITEVGSSKILQGYTEGSNVDVSKEMTDMIVTQRAFELSSKALKTGDDMYGIINNLRGK